jgi:hypothetical protein
MRIISSLVLSLSLSACMTVDGPDGEHVLTKDGFKEIENNTQVPGDNNHSKTSTSKKTHGEKIIENRRYATGYCYRYGRKRDPVPWTSFSFIINKNIDALYAKIMREFGYARRRAVINPVTNQPTCSVDFRYEEIPGSHYQMRSYIKHHYGQEQSKNTIEVDLANEGADKVRIQVSYYSGHTKDKSGYEASLKQRVLKALE